MQTTDSTTPTAQVETVAYRILDSEELETVQNYRVLLTSGKNDEASVNTYAKEIKDKKCSKPCNISFYDDEKALQLDLEYRKITDKETADTWKKNNYVYVADHNVAELLFELDEVTMYPLKDWYYKELTK